MDSKQLIKKVEELLKDNKLDKSQKLVDKDFIELKTNIDEIIDKTNDSIRYYQLCKSCRKNVQITGVGLTHDDEDLIVI